MEKPWSRLAAIRHILDSTLKKNDFFRFIIVKAYKLEQNDGYYPQGCGNHDPGCRSHL
jgi:hypothetical protein